MGDGGSSDDETLKAVTELTSSTTAEARTARVYPFEDIRGSFGTDEIFEQRAACAREVTTAVHLYD